MSKVNFCISDFWAVSVERITCAMTPYLALPVFEHTDKLFRGILKVSNIFMNIVLLLMKDKQNILFAKT
jgi:hypothetical protein